ncbi:MAG TPA: hypothetical protein VN281_14710 [Verrucomicrobiae bacterium]|jgi:hypothetical protein|nr:hypothetical protein [Verrucomicrobiae bacterium]
MKIDPHMIAQLTPDMTKDIAAFLVCLGALLWLYNEGRKAFKRQPPNEELGVQHSALSDRTSRNENSIRELYRRSEANGQALARLETETRLQNAQLCNMDAKLDRLIERKNRQQ